MAPIIRDVNGRERSLAWAQSIFGLFGFLEDPGAEFELYEVWCMCDPGAGLPESKDRAFGESAYGPSVRRRPFAEPIELRVEAQGQHVDPGSHMHHTSYRPNSACESSRNPKRPKIDCAHARDRSRPFTSRMIGATCSSF